MLERQRNTAMPFEKGKSGNPGGRPKVVGEVQALARQHTPEAIKTLALIMHDENAPPAARVSAANAIIDRGYGKPTQPMSSSPMAKPLDQMTDEELAAIASGATENCAPNSACTAADGDETHH
jgi:hypothetical protein